MSVQAIVFGRVGADLSPLQTETPFEHVRTFERFVGVVWPPDRFLVTFHRRSSAGS